MRLAVVHELLESFAGITVTVGSATLALIGAKDAPPQITEKLQQYRVAMES